MTSSRRIGRLTLGGMIPSYLVRKGERGVFDKIRDLDKVFTTSNPFIV